uniref:Glutathione S-transferase epsilon 3 n=1 Tax=Chilo suppressalis TaxID=168631 RepID=A0A0K0XRK4_CHISP|nr:glutathione S-transferase epsilon 3 [Chilo suppressalis]
MPITIYKTDGSPPARAALMIIELLGLKVEKSEVMPLTGDHLKPEFVQKNPVHTIPFLEDGDFKLADSHAILTYLVSKYGAEKKAQLYPCDLEKRATVDQRMYMEATLVFPKIREIIATLFREKKKVPTEAQVEATNEVYGILDKYLEQTKFIAADHLTVADISLVSSISSLEGILPVDKFPKLSEWLETMKQNDWYQTANASGAKTFSDFVKQKSDAL